jgi:hypothetical protein
MSDVDDIINRSAAAVDRKIANAKAMQEQGTIMFHAGTKLGYACKSLGLLDQLIAAVYAGANMAAPGSAPAAPTAAPAASGSIPLLRPQINPIPAAPSAAAPAAPSVGQQVKAAALAKGTQLVTSALSKFLPGASHNDEITAMDSMSFDTRE